MENVIKISTNHITLNHVDGQDMTAEVEGVVMNPSDDRRMLYEMSNHVMCKMPDIEILCPFMDRKEDVAPGVVYSIPGIVEVMHENRATIIKWADGTKTSVVCGEGETYDPYTGFMAAVAKKLFGGTGVAKSVHEAKNLKELEAKARAAEEKAKKEAEEAKAEYERKNAAKIAKRKAKAEEKLIAKLAEEMRIEMLAKEKAEAMIREEKSTT